MSVERTIPMKIPGMRCISSWYNSIASLERNILPASRVPRLLELCPVQALGKADMRGISFNTYSLTLLRA